MNAHLLDCKETAQTGCDAAALTRMLMYIRDAALGINDLESVKMTDELIERMGCTELAADLGAPASQHHSE